MSLLVAVILAAPMLAAVPGRASHFSDSDDILIAMGKPAGSIVVTVVSLQFRWLAGSNYLNCIGSYEGIQMEPFNSEVASQGSGFTVNSNGYIVTNGHVVNDWNSDLLKYQFNFFQWAYYAALLDAVYYDDCGASVAWDVDTWFSVMVQDWQDGFITIQNYDVNVYVNWGPTVIGVGKINEWVPASIIDSVAAEEWDLAVIKVERTNMPTVLLGDSDQLREGDDLWSIGYPGAIQQHLFLDQDQPVNPSIKTGTVSSFQTTQDGTKAIETNLDITHGNSGGMVLNEQGRVAGVSTFGTADPNTGLELAGFNFLRPSNLVKQLLQQNNVQNVQGPTDTTFREGLELYRDHHYTVALEKFRKVAELFPGHPNVNDFITDSQTRIARGEDVPLGPDLATIALIVVVAGGVGGVGGYAAMRRRKAKRLAAAQGQPQAAAGVAPGTMPPPPTDMTGAATAQPGPALPMQPPAQPMPAQLAAPQAPAMAPPPQPATPVPPPVAAPPVQAPRFCPSCGTPIQPGAVFCARCGVRVG